jgi:ribosome-associated protein
MQALGEALIDFKMAELETLDLPENLLNAIRDAKDVHQRGALRRQKQYIGRLMREVDAEPIRKALDRQRTSSDIHRRRFHNAEQWRERIIAQGEPAIAACLEQIPIDPDLVRELAGKAEHAGSQHARKTASTEIFRHLHTALKKQ